MAVISGLRRPLREYAWVVVILAAAALAAPGPCFAQTPPPSRAVLVRGTLSVRGVPYLPANSIPALYGEYSWGSDVIRVWVVRDELFLTGDWKETTIRSAPGVGARWYSREARVGDGTGTVFALRDVSYWIVAEVPRTDLDPRPFLTALVPRLAYFASQARSPEDLSLPAVLDTR